MSEKQRVAVVGLGAMGSRLAANLLDDGHAVVVASRSDAPVAAAAARGAARADCPREAAEGADVVLVCVSDDVASRAVLDGADGVLAAGAGPVVVETSTLSPQRVREAAAASAGHPFVEAPMVGSRPQVEGRALVHLVGGDADAVERVRPVLDVSAGAVHHVGAVGDAAVLKLVVNASLAVQTAMLAELLATVERSSLDADRAWEVLSALPVTSAAAARAGGAMRSGGGPTNFPVRLVRKDLRYAVALADGLDVDAPALRAAAEAFEAAAAAGHDDADLTALGRVHRLGG